MCSVNGAPRHLGAFRQLAEPQCPQRGPESLNPVLETGKCLAFIWKQNLGRGASPRVIKDENLLQQLGQISRNCAAALHINFASIDIIKVHGNYLVLEVNSGIMMGSFVRLVADGYIIAEMIYDKAVDLIFAAKAKRRCVHRERVKCRIPHTLQ